MTSAKDIPGVRVPPPLTVLLTLILGFLLQFLFPLQVLKKFLPFPMGYVIGIFLAVTGIVLFILAVFNFHKIGTNAPPWMPTLKLSQQGIYSYTRNPMYLGFALVIAGIGFGFSNAWLLILLLPFFLIIHFTVVLREETYLLRKFGDDYRRYVHEVPRYGWRVK